MISKLIKGHSRSQKGDMGNFVKIEKCAYGHFFFYIYAYMIFLSIAGYVSLTSGNQLEVQPGT